jgi:uncharacterized membrane protein
LALLSGSKHVNPVILSYHLPDWIIDQPKGNLMIDFLQGKWLKHPLHPALVHVPSALWPAALVFDLLSRIGEGDNLFVQLAFYALVLGLLVALIVIPTGYADWTDIRREKPAWKIGLYHMGLNVTVFLLTLINAALRWDTFQTAPATPVGLVLLSALAAGLLAVSGYLGGRMIYAYGINVARISKKKWRQIAEEGGAALPAEKGE